MSDNTTAASDSTARGFTRVFGVYELVEAIALHLRLRDCFFLRRTSKMFHNVLKTSSQIQHKILVRSTNPDTYDPAYPRSVFKRLELTKHKKFPRHHCKLSTKKHLRLGVEMNLDTDSDLLTTPRSLKSWRDIYVLNVRTHKSQMWYYRNLEGQTEEVVAAVTSQTWLTLYQLADHSKMLCRIRPLSSLKEQPFMHI